MSDEVQYEITVTAEGQESERIQGKARNVYRLGKSWVGAKYAKLDVVGTFTLTELVTDGVAREWSVSGPTSFVAAAGRKALAAINPNPVVRKGKASDEDADLDEDDETDDDL